MFIKCHNIHHDLHCNSHFPVEQPGSTGSSSVIFFDLFQKKTFEIKMALVFTLDVLTVIWPAVTGAH